MTNETQTKIAGTRVMISFLAGLFVSLMIIVSGRYVFAPILGWDAAALTYLILVWPIILPLGGEATKKHANIEDPTSSTAHGILLTAALASIVAAGIILTRDTAGSIGLKAFMALLAIVSVVLSWIVVHTIYTLQYAALYYHQPEGGVNFNQKQKPTYIDFTYLAFTIGMTFQVSDTAFSNHKFRRVAIVHALFSYVFGTVIVATTINLIAGLSK